MAEVVLVEPLLHAAVIQTGVLWILTEAVGAVIAQGSRSNGYGVRIGDRMRPVGKEPEEVMPVMLDRV